jgi:dTDP-4-amino-4,6-dideoxygalactose transaminase
MQLIGEEEIKEVVDLLSGGYIYRYASDTEPNFKAKVLKLEEEMRRLSEVRYALALNAGTSALLTALGALGVGPGDEVIVPGFTFVATMAAVIYARAVPVLAEIDRTFNLDPHDVEAKITPRTKAIIPVHMMGNPARLDELRAIADRHGLYLVEDCCQAFGASYKGRPIGSLGIMGAFSFNIYKTITAGDGGMLITDDEELYRRSFAIHDQGHAPLRYEVEHGERPLIGLDFRMTELQAAVLLAQIRKLPKILKHLRSNKNRYKELIADLPGLEFRELTDPDGECAVIITIILPTAEIAQNIAREIGAKVLSDVGWHYYANMEHILQQRTVTAERCPFTCPYYTSRGGSMQYYTGMLPQSDALVARSLNLSVGLSDAMAGWVYGVTVKDGVDMVEERASKFREVAAQYLQ